MRWPLEWTGLRITEAQWRGLYRQVAGMFGWRGYHTKLSWGSDRGYPDDHFWHPERIVSFWVEAKRDGEKLRIDQEDCIRSMTMAGLRVEVWRPADWTRVVEVLSFGRARAA